MAFPDTKLNIFKKDSPLKAFKLFAFTHGTVILVPIRKTRIMKIVKKEANNQCGKQF